MIKYIDDYEQLRIDGWMSAAELAKRYKQKTNDPNLGENGVVEGVHIKTIYYKIACERKNPGSTDVDILFLCPRGELKVSSRYFVRQRIPSRSVQS